MNRRDVPDVYTQERLYAQGYQSNHNCTSSIICYVTLVPLGGRFYYVGEGGGWASALHISYSCRVGINSGPKDRGPGDPKETLNPRIQILYNNTALQEAMLHCGTGF